MSSETETSSDWSFGYRHGLFEFSPDSLGLHIDGSPEEYPFQGFDPWKQSVQAVREARYMHEEDHFLRTIGTSTGLMAHSLNGRILDSYIQVLASYDLSEILRGKTFFQALRWAVGLPTDKSHRAPALHILAADIDVRNALLGFPVWSPITVVQRSAGRHFGPNLTFDHDATSLWFTPPNRDYPDLPLTSVSLFEALGIIKESLYQADQQLLQPAADYTFAIAYARSQLEGLFNWEVQPVELEVALVLALWPPLRPDGLRAARHYRWEDIEPGHRYRAIIEWLKSRGTALTNHNDLSHEQRDAFFADLPKEMCSELSWPAPDELAQSWLTHLQSIKIWERGGCGWWNLGANGFRTQRAIRFLTWYLSNPFLSYYQDKACRGTATRLRFSYLAYSEHLLVQEEDSDADGTSNSALMEAAVFLGLKYIVWSRHKTPFQLDTIAKHLNLVPIFAQNVENRELFDGNVSYLKRTLLTE